MVMGVRDVILWFGMLALYVLAEDVRPPEEPQTQLAIEQPEDPARYRKLEDVEEHNVHVSVLDQGVA